MTCARSFAVKDDEITTRVASGFYFPEYKIVDAGAMEYSVERVTDFGRKNPFFDMGTSPFKVFLDLKRARQSSLEETKARILPIALQSQELTAGSRGAQVATQRIGGAKSMTALFDVLRKPWRWR